ncbi:MAG: branched-chain amino acid ABC transporter permease [Nitriliruptorales bacterium]
MNAGATSIQRAGLGLLLVILAALPFIPVRIPVLLGGPLNSPGTLNLLAFMLVFGAVALTYDLLFGFTGLLSFGHALYFAVGVYVTGVAVTRFGWTLGPAVLLTVVVVIVLSTVLGAISLRVKDIAFAMVTLAFAQAGSIFVLRDPFRVTGGDEGLRLASQRIPSFFVGVFNTRQVYWLALVLLVVTYAVAWWAVRSRPGRVWQAIRENEQRVEVIGLRPYGYKLLSFVLASFLAALGGVVYVLLVGGAHPTVTTALFTLTLLVMVVLGGTGTLWGAVIGGALYTYLDHRLVALSNSATVADLPGVLRVPLSEPLFILGGLFVLLVLFFPGGIAALATGRRGGALLSSRQREPEDAPGHAVPAGTPAETAQEVEG